MNTGAKDGRGAEVAVGTVVTGPGAKPDRYVVTAVSPRTRGQVQLRAVATGRVLWTFARNYRVWVPRCIVSWDGNMVIIRQQLMTVGQPIAFVFEGVPLVAIKRETGEVDFYAVPKR